jgi:hypothetical protein
MPSRMAQGLFVIRLFSPFLISHGPDETIATTNWPASALGVNGPILHKRPPVRFHSFASISVEQLKSGGRSSAPFQNSITQGIMWLPAFRLAKTCYCELFYRLLSRSVLPTAHCCIGKISDNGGGHNRALTANGGGVFALDARSGGNFAFAKLLKFSSVLYF